MLAKDARVERGVPDLLHALRREIRLLGQYCVKAFDERDHDYLGEVAGKLRGLVCDVNKNTPLLLSLMDHFGIAIPLRLDGPPIKSLPGQPGPGDSVSLREYLDLMAYGVDTPSRGFVQLTKKKLIAIWAAQDGAAHNAWKLTEEFAIGRDMGLYIGGQPALAVELKITASTVLHVAEQFLEIVEKSAPNTKTKRVG